MRQGNSLGLQAATMDGNQAAAHVAYALNEVIAIYPITPSSPMGEWADSWSAQSLPNAWGSVPSVIEMHSEAGVAGVVHGALQAGSLATTFTASQGLLLMIPNMYKIAGELTPAVFHVAARAVATHALSIFGDHSDVMACRQTGFAMLASASVQEVMDFALIAQAASLESRVPFLHFFDGFRTSHEIQKIHCLSHEQMRTFLDPQWISAHRMRALTPDRPVVRGTAQNPDVFFQSREAGNPYYAKVPSLVEHTFQRFAERFGRRYRIFEYSGHPDADRVIVLMGSATQAVEQTIDFMNNVSGERVGVVKVRLFRPFSTPHLLKSIPASTRAIAVLDRTKEAGSIGEPLVQDVQSCLYEAIQNGTWSGRRQPWVCGGRYGLASKEFTPAMVKGIFDELKTDRPKTHFTIGIQDDVSQTSLSYPSEWTGGETANLSCIFYGLGSDGTVSAAKNSIKILADETDYWVQGYFVYDSKKAGSVTESHLRFSKKPIQAAYLVEGADFIGCHQFGFIGKFDVLKQAKNGSTFLLNSPYGKNEIWGQLPGDVQGTILNKKLRFYVVDAYRIAREVGLGQRINTIMQTCFFAISDLLEKEKATEKINKSVHDTFAKGGQEIVRKNLLAVEQALSHLHGVDIPKASGLRPTSWVTSSVGSLLAREPKPQTAPTFFKETLARILEGKGDELPVSALPADGTFPVATSQWEKRQITRDIPVWDPPVCIQCGKCALICPHAAIRIKAYPETRLQGAPLEFKHMAYLGKDLPGRSVYTIQVSPDDCTGCELCVVACPAKNKSQTSLKALNMAPVLDLRCQEVKNWDFFERLPYVSAKEMKTVTVKGSQFLQPLFEFSGACAGCGETPYIKLVTQLFGDRMLIANATGCSSIYGGNLPTTPWCVNDEGRGPSWSNSLFEDNAEFGAGFRLAINVKVERAKKLLAELKSEAGAELCDTILSADQTSEALIYEQRTRLSLLKERLASSQIAAARELLDLCDYLVRKSVWIIGGDGWAYDIGFGGLDHVLASDLNVNILVLDTEVYSNTGGQMSKATPLGAVAKFASRGKATPKKDLALYAIGYSHVYVAKIALGANDAHALKAIQEADEHDGPSLLLAYSPCIAHGYELRQSLRQSKLAVDSGHWPLFRYNPNVERRGGNPFKLDSRAPSIPLKEYLYQESRYKMLSRMDPQRSEELLMRAEQQIKDTWSRLERMAENVPKKEG